jgi:hypothetical protein
MDRLDLWRLALPGDRGGKPARPLGAGGKGGFHQDVLEAES